MEFFFCFPHKNVGYVYALQFHHGIEKPVDLLLGKGKLVFDDVPHFIEKAFSPDLSVWLKETTSRKRPLEPSRQTVYLLLSLR
jgi:hypothetical protein